MSRNRNIISLVVIIFICISCGPEKTIELSEKEMRNKFEQQKAEFNKDALLTLDRDSVKAEHTDKFITLREIVNRHDPIGLIAIGAPEDEYEPEVMTIIVQLKNGMTEEQVHDLVYQEFMRWFNDESTVGPKNFYKELAKDVYEFSRSLE